MFMNGELRLPLLRKIVKIGNSRCVSLPATWLEYYEKELGKEIKNVAMVIKGRFITISPYFEKEVGEEQPK